MRTRREDTPNFGMLVLALAASLLPSCTVEQILIGQEYIITTPPEGACPRLIWQFVVNPQRSIDGVLSRDPRQPIARLTGLLAADDSFQMTATDPADKQTASVTGRFSAQVTRISIHGDAAGSGCDGQTFQLRLANYFSGQGGGGRGGNG